MSGAVLDRFSRMERDRLAALERRVDWLAQRLAKYRGKDPSWDRAELAALRWVLQLLTVKNLPLPLAQILALQRRTDHDPE